MCINLDNNVRTVVSCIIIFILWYVYMHEGNDICLEVGHIGNLIFRPVANYIISIN